MPKSDGPTVAGAIADHLASQGVRRCFGIIGSTNFDVTRGLVDRGVDFVAARHETNAVVMAQAWTQATDELSVVSVHTGPGLTNALTGIEASGLPDIPAGVLRLAIWPSEISRGVNCCSGDRSLRCRRRVIPKTGPAPSPLMGAPSQLIATETQRL
jgi:hypothetical protein